MKLANATYQCVPTREHSFHEKSVQLLRRLDAYMSTGALISPNTTNRDVMSAVSVSCEFLNFEMSELVCDFPDSKLFENILVEQVDCKHEQVLGHVERSRRTLAKKNSEQAVDAYFGGSGATGSNTSSINAFASAANRSGPLNVEKSCCIVQAVAFASHTRDTEHVSSDSLGNTERTLHRMSPDEALNMFMRE